MSSMSNEMERLRAENMNLRDILLSLAHDYSDGIQKSITSKTSSQREKIALFRRLFKGREDVFAVRFESKTGEKGYKPARDLEYNHIIPITDQVIHHHLQGKMTIGIYPVLQDQTCYFLALDFDGKQWKNDVLVFMKTCKILSIPAYVERSRSGEGAHIWMFFKEKVLAKTARQLGHFLLEEAQKDGYKLTTFDRMFPNQDYVSKEGFGNLIALPFQKSVAKDGHTLFVDASFNIFFDQWIYLSTIQRMSNEQIHLMIQSSPIIVEEKENYNLMPMKNVTILMKNGLYINKQQINQYLLEKLKKLASFSNPNYYRAKSKRLSTADIPKSIQCFSANAESLILPRGLMEQVQQLLKAENISCTIDNQSYEGEEIDIKFTGKLTVQQNETVETISKHQYGVLSATTGFGKTVVGAAMIAKRGVNTLIIVHRTQLMKQWIEQLKTFLQTDDSQIGQIGGGANKPTSVIDVVTIQSLSRNNQVASFITQYGQVIIDECHMISAFTFERVLKQIRPKYILGLTATPKRKDGLHPIIEMQCGPIRKHIEAKNQAKIRPFHHRLIKRETQFKTKESDFHKISQAILQDEERNAMIFNDVLTALDQKRTPIILTERIEHVEDMHDRFRGFVKNIIILTGKMTKKERKLAIEHLKKVASSEERLIIATGQYIGEGFDDARLDTLFLTMPITWKGTLQQYVGRLHRDYDSKEEVQVYDYVDHHVPSLQAKFKTRLTGYKSMGYYIDGEEKGSDQMQLF